MELEWFEKNLIIALRVLSPFFKKYNFYITGLELNSIDGEYLIFSSLSSFKIIVILNPNFDILIEKKENFVDLIKKNKTISLVAEKNKFSNFSHLLCNFKDENELVYLLKDYTFFLETNYKNFLLYK